jgi:hypothetical protein
MPYGNYYRGGDEQFYSGPGALESLVGSFLDTNREIHDKKKKDALEAAKRAREAELADQEDTKFALGLRKEGLTKSPIGADERAGRIAPNPTRVGSYVKTGMSADELADIKTVGKQQSRESLVGAFLRATGPERTNRFAALIGREPDVGRMLESQLSPKEPVVKEYLPEWQRNGYPNEAAYLQYLSKEARAKHIPGEGAAAGGRNVNQRIDDLRALAASARGAVPTERPLEALDTRDQDHPEKILASADPAAVRRFVTDSTAKAGEYNRAQGALVGEMMAAGDFNRAPGGQPPAQPGPARRPPAPGYQQATNKAIKAAADAVAAGEMTRAEADALLRQASHQIRKRYGMDRP